MKRTVYLIRHSEPDFPEGKRLCIGTKTDLSLSKIGKEQASVLAGCFEDMSIKRIYCSRLKRSLETAAVLSAGRWPLEVIHGIEEMNCGEWDGLTFDEIKEKYPAIYEVRKTDKSLPPPGGETYDAAAERAIEALHNLINTTQGDLVVVSHAGVNRAVICSLLGIPMKDCHTLEQAYGCINVLVAEDGNWKVKAVGCLPTEAPGSELCHRLWEEYHTPEEVRQHCIAVREQAVKMAEDLALQGIKVHIDILEAAALLHDLCRLEKEHEKKAAEVLREHGWLRLAAIVSQHHDRELQDDFDETDILYLSDKYIQGTAYVSLQQRFKESLNKCKNKEARAEHDRRFQQATEIEKKFLQLTRTNPTRKT